MEPSPSTRPRATGCRPERIPPGSSPDRTVTCTSAEYGASAIGELDPTTGQLVGEYPTPTSGAGPDGITVGSDGAIWFAEQSAGRIGRLDPDDRRDHRVSDPAGRPHRLHADRSRHRLRRCALDHAEWQRRDRAARSGGGELRYRRGDNAVRPPVGVRSRPGRESSRDPTATCTSPSTAPPTSRGSTRRRSPTAPTTGSPSTRPAGTRCGSRTRGTARSGRPTTSTTSCFGST